MFKKHYKYLFIFLFLVCGLLIPQNAHATESKTTEKVKFDKVWSIKFNEAVIFDATTKDAITVTDKNNNKVNISLEISTDNKTISVKPPSDGYKVDEGYTLIIGTKVHSKNGNLKEPYVKFFSYKTKLAISKI